ncbi:uncharacterized protein N7482_002532 [Penicillium canariense]|uniref:Putative zinc-finger domain-containing protein n=1 Tax=Penicillium canariense TaxID=189055 RepID=A0A9W9IG86_9EURO|nr:uncharacterized protein N7482_002532 [Penicillium canariense]KAJ5176655.1 hypothetical protein N7482_002532 [Penicillium canariense]
MSNQPPTSFSGQPRYVQQWPPPYPAMIPPNFPPNPEYQASAPPPHVHPSQAFEYNMASATANANSRIPAPGSSSDQGLFFPPHFPYMNQLEPSQLPFPFPPIPMSSFGYPAIPAPPGSNIPPGSFNPYGTVASGPSESQPRVRDVSSPTDPNREEGEVSEGDGGQSVESSKGTMAAPSHAPAAPRSSLKEGETVSSRPSTSSRSSSRMSISEFHRHRFFTDFRTAYNPPLSVSADADVVNRAIELQKRDATEATSQDIQSARSAAQLRVQAQGALLSLAPHSIRFHELVAEGINPAILKQLYEEVGIRVATPQPTEPVVAPSTDEIAKSQRSTPSKRHAEPAALEKNNATQQSVPGTAQSNSSKPMERKELIAKMLAAKAAKAQSSGPKELSKEPQPTAVTPSPSTTPSRGNAKENGVAVKEKNKAQTELARKRIEALKKQALLKSQQMAQQLNQASQEEQSSTLPGTPVPAVHHPLPVRPPVPQSSELSGIPGLLMADSKPEAESHSLDSASVGIAVDSTPLARTNQRKRPRASDFDEPGTVQKKHFHVSVPYAAPTSDKLIIDISDDESLYGDDEGENMDVDSSLDQDSAFATATATLDIPRPPFQKYPSTTRASTSTPQAPSRPGDQEQMRQKNLEIQALHRKIAEMEERRKAKLAGSRTQSPRTLEDSGSSSSAAQSTAADADLAQNSSAPPSTAPRTTRDLSPTLGMPFAVRPNEIDFFSPSSVRILSSMTIAQLDSIRCQILRMREIESGAPVLDGELMSSQARLAACKDDADKLLSEMTKGEEGPLQLVEELKNLSYEINGLTIADLDELRRQAELKKQRLALTDASMETRPPAVTEESVVPGAPAPAVEVLEGTSVNQDSESDFYVHEPAQLDAVNGPEDSPALSQLKSNGSVMDESVDHVSTGRNSSSDGEPQASGAELDIDSAPVPDTEEMQPDSLDHPLPDRPALPVVDNGEDYEPSDSHGQEALPPPAPVEDTADSEPSLDMSQIGEPLTETPQVSFLEARPIYQGSETEILGAKSPSNTPARNFSPYVSPLRYFNAYRYHPGYAEEVSDGYRSLTYSHDINSMKYLCPYELAGGVCNDRSCEFQHFRDMNLSDDKILIQMGAAREGQTEEEKETYITGLKKIINEMRRDKVKDFSTVASEIAAYRRRFLQDPSRVLPL